MTFSCGLKHFRSETVSLSWFRTSPQKLALMLHLMAGLTGRLVSEPIIMDCMNISPCLLRHIFMISTYPILSFLVTSWWLASGGLKWSISTSECLRIQNVASSSSRTADLLMTIAYAWPACTPRIKLSSTTGPSQSSSVQRLIGWPMLSQDRVPRNTGSFSRVTAIPSESQRDNATLLLKCLNFNLILGFFKHLARGMRYIQQHAWAPSTIKTITSQ